MTGFSCDCSDEYGPCEQHADTLVVREGASLHTADELTLILIEDLVGCGVPLTDLERDELRFLNAQLSANTNPHSGCGWFSAPDVADSARWLADRIESKANGLMVISDDGYVIVRPHPDCPLLDTGGAL